MPEVVIRNVIAQNALSLGTSINMTLLAISNIYFSNENLFHSSSYIKQVLLKIKSE